MDTTVADAQRSGLPIWSLMMWHGRAVCVSALFAIALSAPACAEPAPTSYSSNGVSLEFPAWHRVSPEPDAPPVRRVLAIEPDDLEATQRLRRCDLETAELPYAPGTTQAMINARILQRTPEEYAQSPIYREFGSVDGASTAEVDGIAVYDITVRGTADSRGPMWMHDRTFAIVTEPGQGTYYRLSCASILAPLDEHVAEMNAILATLRFNR